MRRSTRPLGFLSAAVAALALLAACTSSPTSSPTTTQTLPSLAGTTTPATDGGSSSTSGTAAPGSPSVTPIPTSFVNTNIVPSVAVDTNGSIQSVPSANSSALDPGQSAEADCGTAKLAVVGPLTGDLAAVGTALADGAQLAVAAHNAANAQCQVKLERIDTKGSASAAAVAAKTLAADPTVLGVIGPATSDEASATGGILNAAGIVTVSPSATSAGLTTQGWKTFFRAAPSDAATASAVGTYMVKTLNLFKVCVVDDGSVASKALAAATAKSLGGSYDSVCSASVTSADALPALATKTHLDGPDGLFFAGYYPLGAAYLKAMRAGGVNAQFVGADGVDYPQFVAQAGVASAGATLSCTCVSAPTGFATSFTTAFKTAAPPFAVEAYDVAAILLKGIDAGHHDRASLRAFVAGYNGPGLAHTYQWDASGNLTSGTVVINQVQ